MEGGGGSADYLRCCLIINIVFSHGNISADKNVLRKISAIALTSMIVDNGYVIMFALLTC